MRTTLHSFAEGISKLGLTEVGQAIALLWYFDLQEGKPELRPAFLAELMHDLSLRRQVSATRLGRQVLANRAVTRGKEMGGAGAVMGKMDYVGDLAAHHPTYTTRQKDIDEQRLAFHRVISELAHLAEIKSQATAG
jgi:hypothetical protein